jgi:predicted dehydrogenase
MRLGTIGTNWITEKFIDAAKLSGDLVLNGIYSRSSEKAKIFAEKYQAAHSFTDLETMAKSPDLDVIYIASPNSLHFEQAQLFMRHGKHIICEKPIFSNTAEFDAAMDIAKENNVFLIEAVRNIHNPNFYQLKKHLEKVGIIRGVVFHAVQYSSRYDAFLKGEEPNVFSRKFSGGALTDVGVYPVFLAVTLFDMPKKITYHPVLLRNGIDGAGTLLLDYENFVCTILCSKISEAYSSSEIQGENGSILIDKPSRLRQLEWVDRRTEQRQFFHEKMADNDMVYEIKTIVKMIKNHDEEAFRRLANISRSVLTITESARKENGIIFGVEEP